MSDTCKVFPVILEITGEIIENNIYIPITTFTYFLQFPSGKTISIIVPIITATIIPCAQLLIQFIILITIPYLYISPLLDIFIIKVTPTTSITETLHIIAKNILNVSPICSNNFIIFSSAIGWHKAAPK